MAELTGRRQRLFQGQGRLDAHVLGRARTSTAATASSARRRRSAPASPSPTNTAAMTASRLTYFGDGAANQGQVYESFNMAELWKLPGHLHDREQPICHGHRGRARSALAEELYQRGVSFRIPGDAGRRHGRARGARPPAKRAIALGARAARAPMILEMKTYRYRGHSMSDPAKYRTREEVAGGRARPRPDRPRRASGWRSAACRRGRPEGNRQGVSAIVTEAAEFATSDPSPTRASSTPTSWCSRSRA